MENRKILLGLTTTPGSDWREKVREINELRIKEIALFPTCLNQEERKELYALLEKTGLEQIPHVHLRDDDMNGDELEYFVKRYNTQVFNLHPKKKAYEFLGINDRFRKMIYIENLYRIIAAEQFSEAVFEQHGVAGICLDTSHLRSEQLIYPENYAERIKLFEKYRIGCNHVSAIVEKPYNWEGFEVFDIHMLTNLSELDYLKNFPKQYFSDVVSIELENSLKEQLEAKKYIKDIINNIKE